MRNLSLALSPHHRRFNLLNFRNLADTQDRGALDSIDFAIGMYFIKAVMNNQISVIPHSLPPGLYHQACGDQQDPVDPEEFHISGNNNSGSFSPISGSFQPQHTDQDHISQPDITEEESHIADVQNTQEDLIEAESVLSALCVEKADIEAEFLRDKEEARELHKRMIETVEHVEAVKADIEKLKMETRRQKGMLAIARNQLGALENEKAKVERERAEAVEELSSITRDKDTVDAELATIMTSLELTTTTNEVTSELPGSDLLPISISTVDDDSFLADQTPASPKSSQHSDDLHPRSPATVNIFSVFNRTHHFVTSPINTEEHDSASLAHQTPASPKSSSQPSDDLHFQSPATVNRTDYIVTSPIINTEHDPASLAHPNENFSTLDGLPDSPDRPRKPQTVSPI